MAIQSQFSCEPRSVEMSGGKVLTCKAAVLWAPNEKLKIENIEVDPPKKGEVRVKIVSTSLCHSDLSASTGRILGVAFPIVLGHEGSGIIESVGEGVTGFKAGDHVIPCFLPQCKNCHICKHETGNMCLQFVGPQMKGLMLDGTSRLRCKDKTLHTFVGCSTFAEYTVLSENSVCKINKKAPLNKVCLLSCGVPTGYGAAVNTAKVKAGSTCAVWGLGALGLAAMLGCKNSGAKRIIAIDINPDKFEVAKKFGATECINPSEIVGMTIQDHLRSITGGGVDYTFECIGNIQVMKQAFESAAVGYGVCVLLGVAPSGQELNVMPIDFQTGRTLKGTLFGCYKSMDSIPVLVEDYIAGKLQMDELITHTVTLENINDAFDLLRQGKSIRTLVNM